MIDSSPTPHIREFDFSDADYDACLRINNVVFPENPETVSERRFRDADRDPKIRWKRFVAEVDNTPVGVGGYGQDIDMFHPQKFNVDATVLPEFQGHGIGKRLFEHVTAAVTAFDPILLRTYAREDYDRSVRFLTERGFVEAMREWESRFDPQNFDPAPFDGARQQVKSSGIVIKSLSELSTSDPNWKMKLRELDWAITLDMPTTDTLTQPSFEHFENKTLGNPNILPDAWFVAVDGDRYVGESQLWKSQSHADELHVGATGVLQEYRRRGIATALKLAAADYARQTNIREVRTWNAQQNRAMLSINEAMGFTKLPAWISYEKAFAAD